MEGCETAKVHLLVDSGLRVEQVVTDGGHRGQKRGGDGKVWDRHNGRGRREAGGIHGRVEG